MTSTVGGGGVVVLAGGVGAAKLLAGLARAVPPESVTAIVNVGDDFELHGLQISPDLDTVVYTLAGAIDPERGWGLQDETWHAMEGLDRYGAPTWFRLGDRDLATHLFRTERRAAGASLSQVTADIAVAWGLSLRITPVTDDPLRTIISLAGEGGLGASTSRDVTFQEYFVQLQHSVPVSGVRFDGEAEAQPAPGVLETLATAGTIVIAPSNPLISIAPVLAVPGVRDALIARRERVVAISPIVDGKALKGPADRLLPELGHEPSVVGVAQLYAPVASTLVIDEADAARAEEVRHKGLRCVVTDTIMRDPVAAAKLSESALAALGGGEK